MTNLMQFWLQYQAGDERAIKALANQARALLRPDRIFDTTRFLMPDDIELIYLTGIYKTLESYDPSKGMKFSTYLKRVVDNLFIAEIRKFSFQKRYPTGGLVRLNEEARNVVTVDRSDQTAEETERARFRAVRRIYWKLRRQEENVAAEIFVFRQVFPKVPFKKVNRLFRVKNAGYHFWKAKKFREMVIEEAENICLSE